MIDSSIWTLGATFKISGSTFIALAAYFGFVAVLQNDEHEGTGKWFEDKWQAISKSSWRDIFKSCG